MVFYLDLRLLPVLIQGYASLLAHIFSPPPSSPELTPPVLLCLPINNTQNTKPQTHTPINAVIFNFIVQVAVLCLIFAGPLAIAAIFSIGATGAYFAFTMPVAMKLFFAGPRWRPGPWNLGRWSVRMSCLSPVSLLSSLVSRRCPDY